MNGEHTSVLTMHGVEIDFVLGHKTVDDVLYYNIRFKGEKSAWMRASQVPACKPVIYYQQVMQVREVLPSLGAVRHFVRDACRRRPRDALALRLLCCAVFGVSEEMLLSLDLSFGELRRKALTVTSIPSHRLQQYRRRLLRVMRFAEARKHALLACAEFERRTGLRVKNDVDCARPSLDFTSVRDYVGGPDVDLSVKGGVSCACVDCGAQSDGCCAAQLGGWPPYDAEGRIQVPPGHEVYECSDDCACGPGCPFRVVGRGQGAAVTVFRTRDGRGWGLRADTGLEKGHFAIEYLGEVITREESEARDAEHDATGATYLFDLDGGRFTVDSRRYGNAARFTNHSCDPNMQVYCVWDGQRDPALPRLALFARRRIRPGDELTFDYRMDTHPGGELVPCRCGYKDCRKFLY